MRIKNRAKMHARVAANQMELARAFDPLPATSFIVSSHTLCQFSRVLAHFIFVVMTTTFNSNGVFPSKSIKITVFVQSIYLHPVHFIVPTSYTE